MYSADCHCLALCPGRITADKNHIFVWFFHRKRGRSVMFTTWLHLVLRSRTSIATPFLPLYSFMELIGTTLTLVLRFGSRIVEGWRKQNYLFPINNPATNDQVTAWTKCHVLKEITASHLTWLGPGISVGIATGYGLEGPGIESRWGEFFRTCPDRPSVPTSLRYDGYRVFPGCRKRPGRNADTSPLLVPRSKNRV
jgi:hypothetical protein